MQAVIYSANNSHRNGRMTLLRPNSDRKNLSESESGPSSAGNAPVLSGYEVQGATPVPVNKYQVDAEIAFGSIILNTVWAWIAALRMRLKIKSDLGRKATQADLTSIDTWMKVQEVEQRKALDKPPSPD
jgi:hypothetical protein